MLLMLLLLWGQIDFRFVSLGGRQFVNCRQQLIRQMSWTIQISRKCFLLYHPHKPRSLQKKKKKKPAHNLNDDVSEISHPSCCENRNLTMKIRCVTTWNKFGDAHKIFTVSFRSMSSPFLGYTYKYQFYFSYQAVKKLREEILTKYFAPLLNWNMMSILGVENTSFTSRFPKNFSHVIKIFSYDAFYLYALKRACNHGKSILHSINISDLFIND